MSPDPLTEFHASCDRSLRDRRRERDGEGPEPGRCGSCGQFVGDGAIICRSCDLAERRRDFEAMLP